MFKNCVTFGTVLVVVAVYMAAEQTDAVHALGAIVGYDVLAASRYIPRCGYTQFLKMDGLRGKRIGIPNVFFQGTDAQVLKVYETHLHTSRYTSSSVGHYIF
jgi:amidase